ncbi:MAG: hypothetical protein ACRCZ9_00690 [Fusobacteriaceae bacterium]
MHTNDSLKIYKMQLKELLHQKIIQSRHITATEAFNQSRRELCSVYNFESLITSLFPSFDSLKSVIYRYISKTRPSSSLSYQSLDPFQFLQPSGVNMLLCYEFNTEKFIIMGSVEFIRSFSRNNPLNLIMDGTFKSSSTSFFQLYFIYADFDGQVFPLIYNFLESKTEATYVRMFNLINSCLS